MRATYANKKTICKRLYYFLLARFLKNHKFNGYSSLKSDTIDTSYEAKIIMQFNLSLKKHVHRSYDSLVKLSSLLGKVSS